MIQRIRDWRRERQIDAASKACREAYEAGDKAKASHYFQQMREVISARSAQQVERMELRRGLRARTALKRGVMNAFLRGWLPSRAVVLAFRLFDLLRL